MQNNFPVAPDLSTFRTLDADDPYDMKNSRLNEALLITAQRAAGMLHFRTTRANGSIFVDGWIQKPTREADFDPLRVFL
jgi:hypothetical protein